MMRKDAIVLRPENGRWKAGVGMGPEWSVPGTTNAGYLDVVGSWETEQQAERGAIHEWQLQHGRDALPSVVVVHLSDRGVAANSRPLSPGVMQLQPAPGLNVKERKALGRWRAGEPLADGSTDWLRDVATRCRDGGWYLPELDSLEAWLRGVDAKGQK